MKYEPDPGHVFQLVQQTFGRLGVDRATCDDLFETLRFSRFGSPGRHYHAGDHRAEWLVDEGIVRFFDPSRKLLLCLNLWLGRPSPENETTLRAA